MSTSTKMNIPEDLQKGSGRRAESLQSSEWVENATLEFIEEMAGKLMVLEDSVPLFDNEQVSRLRKINEAFDNATQRYHQQEDSECMEILWNCDADLRGFYNTLSEEIKVKVLNNNYQAEQRYFEEHNPQLGAEEF